MEPPVICEMDFVGFVSMATAKSSVVTACSAPAFKKTTVVSAVAMEWIVRQSLEN